MIIIGCFTYTVSNKTQSVCFIYFSGGVRSDRIPKPCGITKSLELGVRNHPLTKGLFIPLIFNAVLINSLIQRLSPRYGGNIADVTLNHKHSCINSFIRRLRAIYWEKTVQCLGRKPLTIRRLLQTSRRRSRLDLDLNYCIGERLLT